MEENIISSWSTPIIRYHKIFDNQEKIKHLCHQSTETVDMITGDMKRGIPIIDNDIINDLKSWILFSASNTIAKINQGMWTKEYKPKFWDMWAWSSNDYDNPYHGHYNSSWGGAYCVDAGDETFEGNNGATMLYSPLPWGTYADPGVAFLERQSKQWHNLATGDLLLFPFWVKHSAKYKGIKNRTIIGFSLVFD